MKIHKTLSAVKISDEILWKLRGKFRVGLPEEHPLTFEYSANIPKKFEKNILSELEKDGVIRNLNFHEDRNSYDFVATDKNLEEYHDKIREILKKKDKYFPPTEDKNLELVDFEAMVVVGEDIAKEIGAKNINKCLVCLYYPQKDPAEITFITVEPEPVKRDISSGYVYKPTEPVIHHIYYDAKLFKEKGLELLKLRGVVKEYSIIPGDDMSKYKANVDIPGKKVFLQKLESLKRKYEERKEHVSDKTIEQKISLKSVEIKYIDKEAVLEIGGRRCLMPPNKNEHYFCRAMYEDKVKVNEPVSWDIIYEKMTGGGGNKTAKQKSRSVYDAMESLKNRIKKDVNTDDDLFSFNERTVRRNY